MITEFLYWVFAGFQGWVLSLMPEFDTGPFLAGINGTLAAVSSGAIALGGWIPWGQVAITVPIVTGLYVITLVARAIKSFIPTISG